VSKNSSETHVLGPVSEPEEAVEDIFNQISSQGLLLDLSAGQLLRSHTLKEQVSADQEIPDEVEWVNGQQYADVCAEASRRAYIKWIAQQPDEPIVGEYSLKELFTYDGISLWWFTSMATKHPVSHPFRWIFYMIHVLDHCRQWGDDADEWHLWMPTKNSARLLEHECLEGEDVHTHVVGERGGWTKNNAVAAKIRRIFGPMYLLVQRGGKLLLETARNTWASTFKRNQEGEQFSSSGTPTILVETKFPHSWVEKGTDEYDRDIECVDRYFELAPWALQDHGYDVAWMPTLSGRQAEEEWEVWKERQTLPEVSDEMNLQWHTVFYILGTVWWWLGIYLWCFEVRSIHSTFSYRNASFGQQLRDEIRRTVSGATGTLKRIEKYRAAGQALEPDVVLYRDEFYGSGRCVASGLDDTATLIGIQHALIGHEHTVYQFHNSEIESVQTVSSDYVNHCPVPDYFASFGEQFVDLFEEWDGYPPTRVWAVGGLRHDTLLDKYGNLSPTEKRDLRSALGLPLDVPVILLCTGARSQVGPWTRMVAQAIQELDREGSLAVKLHQYHGGKEEAQDAVRSTGVNQVRIYEDRVYPLLTVSDIIIGGGSTVLLEAGLLGTPAIALESPTAYRNYNFDGLALSATTTQELVRGMIQITERGEEARKVRSHLGNVDGNRAVARLVNCANQAGVL